MSYTNALGEERDGNLIEIEGMAYQLHEPWTLESLKEALEQTGSKPLLCRLGLHSWETVANYEPLPPGVPENLLKHTIGLMRHLGEVQVCKRCKHGRKRFA